MAMILSLAACGGSDKSSTTEPETSNTSTEAPQSDRETEEATDALTEEPLDDDAAIETLKETIVGDWGFPGDGSFEDIEHLTFREDGTGTYKGPDKNYTFTYVIHVDHRTYNNGAAYVENMLKMSYSTGETEDIIFFFTEQGKLAFHNSENGGYNGVMENLDVFTKE